MTWKLLDMFLCTSLEEGNNHTYIGLQLFYLRCSMILFCVAYLILSLFLCSLPWQGLKARIKKEKYERISEKKVSTSVEVICLLSYLRYSLHVARTEYPVNRGNKFFKNCFQELCRGYPTEIASYFHYCRSLRFEDEPDYAYLKRVFRDLFIREGI